MEHTHPSPSISKSTKQYLAEFFMLFAAVTLGFFAENIREKIADKERSRELIEVVAKDLKSDVEMLNMLKDFETEKIKQCDTFRTLLSADPATVDQKDYYRVLTNYSVFFVFTPNDKSRIDAESKGYFLQDEYKELSDYIRKYNFWLSDYKELDKLYVGHAQRYLYDIIPLITDPEIYDRQWRYPFPELESKKGIRPMDPAATTKAKYYLSHTKAYMDTYKTDIDSMVYYANKAIKLIERNK